jgi:hypothetical protein
VKSDLQVDREIDDLWLLLQRRIASGASKNVLTLIANFVGGEETLTAATYTDMAVFSPSPGFISTVGQKLYVAAYLVDAASGQVDLYDITSSASVLGAPVTFTNTSPSVIVSQTIVTPLNPAHSYKLRGLVTHSDGGQELLVQSAWVL